MIRPNNFAGNHLRPSEWPSLPGMMLIILFLTGCGKSGESDEARLLKKQRLQQAKQAGQSLSFEERLKQSQHEYESGNYQNVLEASRRMLREQPNNPELILLTARTLAAINDVASATAVFERLTPDDPESFQTAMRLAASLNAERGNYDAAVNLLQRLFDSKLDDSSDRHEMASLLNNSGRRIEASATLRPLLRDGELSERELFSLVTLGSPFIDSSRPKPQLGATPMPSALAEARAARENDTSKALPMARVLFETYPESHPLFAFYARVLAEQQQWDELSEVVSRRPPNADREPEYWFAIGLKFQHEGKYDIAIRCFLEAIRRDPTDRYSYLNLGRCFSSTGRQELSEFALARHRQLTETSSLIRKIGLKPGTESQLNRLADLLDGLGRPFEANAWRKISLASHSGDSVALSALADTVTRLRAESPLDGDELSGALFPGNPSLGDEIPDADLADWPLPDASSLRAATGIAPDRSIVPHSHLAFLDVAGDTGLEFRYVNRKGNSNKPFQIYHLNGGGIGVLDYDRDGWPDAYFSQAGGPPMQAEGSLPNALFRNLAGAKFSSVGPASGTADLGFGQGVTVADLNQDGFPDLLVANIGACVWYQNQGDGTFSKQFLSGAGAHESWTTSIACGDLNGDHLPEIVLANYTEDDAAFELPCDVGGDFCSPQRMDPAADQILTITAQGRVENWNGGLPDDAPRGHAFAAVVTDIDQRPGNELLVLNDTDANFYWRSSSPQNSKLPAGSGAAVTLRESAQLFGLAAGLRGNRQGCMGVALADLDRNGLMDFHVTNFWNQPSDLYLQQPGGFFENGSMARGISQDSLQTVGWGTCAADLDHDGWSDLAVLNGHVVDYGELSTPYRMRPQLFRGGPRGFTLMNRGAGEFWESPALGRALAKIDFDRDGKLDLLAAHLDTPVALLHNRSDSGRWIQIQLIGVESERDAIGAQVTVEVQGQRHTAWVAGGDGFQCQSEAVLDFGLGELATDTPESARVEIRWPSGETQHWVNLAPDRKYQLVQGQAAFESH